MENQNQDNGTSGYGFDDFLEDEIKDCAFTVTIHSHKFFFHIVFILIPIIFYFMFHGFFKVLDYTDMGIYANGFRFLLFLFFVMGLVFFFYNCGKEIVVSGRGMVLRSCFIFNESISVSDIEKCEVITGLTTHGRYHTEHYSKAVIYFGGGRSYSITDNMYKGWGRLVRYMEMNNKVERIDGRSTLQKALDNMIGGK